MGYPIQIYVAARIKPMNKPTDKVILTAGSLVLTVPAMDAIQALVAAKLNGHPAEPSPAAPSPPTDAPPAIGAYWKGHGGEYVGMCRFEDGRQYHLILGPEAEDKMTHADALTYVQSIKADGHSDFARMTRRTGALCYANLPERFKKEWYWLDEQSEPDDAYAWCQDFGDGIQLCANRSNKCRVRAVRVEIIQ